MTSGDRRDLGRPRGTVMTAVASSAFAALAVLALVGVLILAFGRSPAAERDRQAQDVIAEPRLTAVPEPAVVTQSEEAELAEEAPEVEVPEIEVPEIEVPEEPATPGPNPTAGPGPGSIEVVVLNQTTRTGLAAVFQDVLTDGGWTVKRIGDFRGNVPETTVYYPPGFKAEAGALAAQFDQVDRIRPAFPGAPKKRLTVILCKDYPKT